MTTTANGWRLDDIRLRAAFRRLSELDFPLLAHPALEPLPDVYADFALTASVSPVVSTVGAGRLCLGTDYPLPRRPAPGRG